ncbi:methyl-accepting chemotaxis protein [Paenibacillus sp. JX-17]|uniref:Methyl-accepting chemotaxis protein n=1 Tax=Paenibacillus lacisoli TaxID=3064525 RepID=A0ABT9CAZ9_9BACL|nr:methyl-accepting chemotaxis protein [Paenibacillus sp. JX-17]MDO7906440.1 methyl-accepting chemotaxis protein [Paenibacillus sp. JX-17]
MTKKGKSKKRAFFTLTVRKKLLISFLLILLIPSLVIGTVTYEFSKKEAEAQLMASASESVRTVNTIIDTFVGSKLNDVDYFVKQLNGSMIEGKDSPQIVPKLKQYIGLHPDSVDIFIGTPDGTMIRGVPKANENGYDPRTREWYVNALKQPGKPLVSSVNINSKGIPVVVVSQQLPDQSGVLGISLNLDNVREMAALQIGREGYVMMLDHTQKYIVHPTVKPGTESKEDFVQKMYTAEQGQFNYMLEDKAKKLTYVTNAKTGWKIAGTMFQDEVTHATATIRMTTFIVLGASLLLAIVAIYFITRSITRPLLQLQGTAKRISRGNLAENIDTSRKDELGDLARYFQRMVDNLRAMIMGIQEATMQISGSAEQLAAGADQTTRAIEHVTNSIQEVASGTEHQVRSVGQGMHHIQAVSSDVNQMSGRLEQMSGQMEEAASSAEKGNEAAADTVRQIHEIDRTVNELGSIVDVLKERSEEIGGVVGVIAGIAKQTNLLALNASIEAARAGDHGKGFAVVATEVRKLAEESAKSAQHIQDQIQRIQQETSSAQQAMQTAKNRVASGINTIEVSGQSFSVISETVLEARHTSASVTEAARMMAERAASVVEIMSEVSSVSAQSAENTESISAAAQEQLASIEEISSAAAELNRMADQLKQVVSQFQLE